MLQIEYRNTIDLDLLHNNPRTISDESFARLCASIRKNRQYFEARPLILSNRTGLLIVIAGNMRMRAALENGMTSVPTVLIPDLTEEEEVEIIIRDNVNNGEWDFDMLANEFANFDLSDWGLNIPDSLSFDDESENKDDDNSDSSNDQAPSVAPLPEIKIIFDDLQVYDTVKLEVEELLKGYPGASIKE